MATAMTARVDASDTVRRVQLKGGITEESDFQSLVPKSTCSIYIDLGEVELINSCGVREWINFVRSLDELQCQVVLANCSPPIVRQLNMISNFRGQAQVSSIQAPYFCDYCSHEAVKVIELADADPDAEADTLITETIPCPECGRSMTFDDLSDSYLEFRHHR